MDRTIEPLVVSKVIGDVLDMFTPAVEFTVHYGPRQVANGCEIKPSNTAQKPHVQILGSRPSSALYTLVMVDPDAPSPSDPFYREWLHWIVLDIPEGSDATKGKELVPYMGPQPAAGIHRYIFTLFKQRGVLMGRIPPPDARSHFKTGLFAAQNGLGLPVAATYFNSQKETVVKRR